MSAPPPLDITTPALDGRHVRLERFTAHLRDAVGAALSTDPDALLLTGSNYGADGFADWWPPRLAATEAGHEQHFAVRRLADGAVVGSTGYLNLRANDLGVEIGHTFYRPDARGGPVNPECKYLLLAHAFAVGAMRVEIRTDALNLRSRAAIEKLGARLDGVLRRHSITWTGRIRDVALYSITDEDWPQVRARLEARLAAFV